MSLGNRSGKRTGPELWPEPPSATFPPGDWEEGGWTTPTGTEKTWKGATVDFLLSEAGSPAGQSPGRHTHPGWSPRLPGRCGPGSGPAASRALPACLTGRSRKPAPGSCPPPLAFRRPHSSSHLPAPQEEPDASPPRGAATGSDPSIASGETPRRGLRAGREGGGTAGVKGRAMTSPEGAGLRSLRLAAPSRQPLGRPELPVWVWPPRLQVAAGRGCVVIRRPQTAVASKQSSYASPLAPLPVASEMMGLPIRILEFCCEKWTPSPPNFINNQRLIIGSSRFPAWDSILRRYTFDR